MITITLRKIHYHNPCEGGWGKILAARGGDSADWDEEFPLADAFHSNDLEDVLWALRCLPEHDSLWRKYAVWCARQIEHLMTDERSHRALGVAWAHSNGEASDNELYAAWDAARDAAWDAAAAQAAAAAAPLVAAALAEASAAALAAASAEASAAALAAASAEASAAQQRKLMQILRLGAWTDAEPGQQEGE